MRDFLEPPLRGNRPSKLSPRKLLYKEEVVRVEFASYMKTEGLPQTIQRRPSHVPAKNRKLKEFLGVILITRRSTTEAATPCGLTSRAQTDGHRRGKEPHAPPIISSFKFTNQIRVSQLKLLQGPL